MSDVIDLVAYKRARDKHQNPWTMSNDADVVTVDIPELDAALTWTADGAEKFAEALLRHVKSARSKAEKGKNT